MQGVWRRIWPLAIRPQEEIPLVENLMGSLPIIPFRRKEKPAGLDRRVHFHGTTACADEIF
jgi:hypothetical protein